MVLLCHQRRGASLNGAGAQRWAQGLPSDRLTFSFQSCRSLATGSSARKFHLFGIPHGTTPTSQGHAKTAWNHLCGVFHTAGIMMMTIEPTLGLGIQSVRSWPRPCLCLTNYRFSQNIPEPVSPIGHFTQGEDPGSLWTRPKRSPSQSNRLPLTQDLPPQWYHETCLCLSDFCLGLEEWLQVRPTLDRTGKWAELMCCPWFRGS